MIGELNFEIALMREILINLNNDHHDNYDNYRFGKQPKQSFVKATVRKPFLKLLAKRDFHKQLDKNNSRPIEMLREIDQHLNGLKALFSILSDEESKALLLKLIAFRVLDNRKVKLPLNTREYWAGVKEIESITNFDDFIPVKFMSSKLWLINLNKIGIPLEFYLQPIGVYVDFILKQYEYKTSDNIIKAKNGDYVIDAGGCWGDTALYFANEVGDKGKVFTYEFIPSNLAVLYKNLSLNTKLNQKITVIEKPVWEDSDVPMYFIDNGPGSKVFLNHVEKHDGRASSLSIDDLVEQENIPKIDFIKMDIEGAELYALKGAIKTIKKFRPVLAIAIYHSWDDFVNIPAYIQSLDLGYKLFLGHYTIHAEETIIFAESPR
ncbi:MAG: hypothetical protein JWP94_1099 [Mucilaginibacter sp.]|nr:hypothetical protein [Mucilaginibacter sp.]